MSRRSRPAPAAALPGRERGARFRWGGRGGAGSKAPADAPVLPAAARRRWLAPYLRAEWRGPAPGGAAMAARAGGVVGLALPPQFILRDSSRGFYVSSIAAGQLGLREYMPDRSKQQGRRFPLAIISQPLAIRFNLVLSCMAESIH